MEKLRTDRWAEVAIVIQKNARRYIARQRYKKIQAFIIKIQQVARKKHGQATLQRLREYKAATVIQSYWRMHVIRKAFLERRAFIIKLQTVARSLVAKKQFKVAQQHKAATQIQRMIRGWMVRRLYQTKRHFIIRIQSSIRRRQARKQLVVIKAEARSVSHFKEVSYKLETRVVELTQSLNRQKEEKGQLKVKATELESLVRNWIERYDKLDERASQLDPSSAGLDDTSATTDNAGNWKQWNTEREGLEQEYVSSLNKIKHQDKEIERLRDELTKQKTEMTKLRDTSQMAVQSLSGVPNVTELKSQIAALKTQLSHTLNRQPHRMIKQQSSADPYSGTALSQPDGKQQGSNTNFDIDLQVAQELHSLLLDEQTLHKEIYESLIRLSITDPTTRGNSGATDGDDSSAKQEASQDGQPIAGHIHFPAHVIDLCLTLMWKLGDLAESEQFIFSTIDVIRKHCQVSSCGRGLNVKMGCV
jgi:myosin-5